MLGGVTVSTKPERMPVVFLPHGGGPWPFVEMGLDPTEVGALAEYTRSVARLVAPKALLVVSAHWEEATPTLMTAEEPPMLYDYYGFPPESYRLSWPAPGAPALAARVQQLLEAGGLRTGTDERRGFDHGTFVPLMLAYPEARIPTLQLSLLASLDAAEHLQLGRALAPLRDEGVLLIGSGMSFHNLRIFGSARAKSVSEEFDAWLREAGTEEPAERDRRLTGWQQAPSARAAHPREEHLLPLMVAAGAAGDDRGELAYSGTFMGARLSAFHFGVAFSGTS